MRRSPSCAPLRMRARLYACVAPVRELLRRLPMAENIEASSASASRRIEDLLMRIEGEFLDVPELRLTVSQAQRHFGVDQITCEAILDALVDAGVLFKTADRVYS